MTIDYNIRHVEKKWKERFAQPDFYSQADHGTKEKKYILEMLPYPSGKLHMGHVRNYTIGDALVRFYTHLGYDVMHPMGWDSFGLPAENAAIEHQRHPKDWTQSNIAEMKKQMMALGFNYDWSREVTTCDPSYYGLEQRIFLDFYEKGLAYRKKSSVNWDPVEQTVLANEQVIDGRGWRSGALVEKKELTQWQINITHYAQELLDDLEKLTGWPEKVRRMQQNWIGRSQGAMIDFTFDHRTSLTQDIQDIGMIRVFSTRPETLFGASFIAISPNHPLAKALASHRKDLAAFIEQTHHIDTSEASLSTQEKQGIDTGIRVMHPLDESIFLPVYIANFVIMEYGTGAIFGCPAHDERDFEFATKYHLPIECVILPIDGDKKDLPYTTKEGVMVHSNFLNGLHVADAVEAVIKQLESSQKGHRHITYRLRDWLISRQRYWGCPIPIVYCDDCGTVALNNADLPIKLPDDVSFDQVGNPLDHHPTWKHTTCPRCGQKAVRETDTLDTFFESSWYFLRYCCPHAPQIVDPKAIKKWMSVDWYIGGVEHAVLHLLYARFFTKALRDLGYIDCDEPFTNLMTQGMVCHITYKDDMDRWLYPSEVKKTDDGHFVTINENRPVTVGRVEKMSKSRKNLIDPNEMVQVYGADCVRLFILSDTPVDKDFDWNEDGLEGCWRYLNRLWRLGHKVLAAAQGNHCDVAMPSDGTDFKARQYAHRMLRQMTECYEKMAFNKAIALNRELCHFLDDHVLCLSPKCAHEIMVMLIMSLAPITPFIAHELWDLFKAPDASPLVHAPWPVVDEALLQRQEVTIAVQINGKLRTTVDVQKDLGDHTLEDLVLRLVSIQPYLVDKDIKKVVVVKNRVVNIVVVDQ
jgi:leucyl-tRNA synthetase